MIMLIKENWFKDDAETDIVKDIESSQSSIYTTFNKRDYEHCLTFNMTYSRIMLSSESRMNIKNYAYMLYFLLLTNIIKSFGIEILVSKGGIDSKEGERITFAADDIADVKETSQALKEFIIESGKTLAQYNFNIYFTMNKKTTCSSFSKVWVTVFKYCSCFFSGYDPKSKFFSSPSSACDKITIDGHSLFEDITYQTMFYFSSENPSNRMIDFERMYQTAGGTAKITDEDIDVIADICQWDSLTRKLVKLQYSGTKYSFDISSVNTRNNVVLQGKQGVSSQTCIIRMSDLYDLCTQEDGTKPISTTRICSHNYYNTSLIVDCEYFRDSSKPSISFAEDDIDYVLIDGVTVEGMLHVVGYMLNAHSSYNNEKEIYIKNISDIDVSVEPYTFTTGRYDIPVSMTIKPYIDANKHQEYDIKTTRKKGYYQTITISKHVDKKKRSSKTAKTTAEANA